MTQISDQDAPERSHLLDRQLAAAYVGVTIGRFERLIREQIVPEPVVVGRKPLWSARLLDQSVDAIRRLQGAQATEADRPSPAVSGGGLSNPGLPSPSASVAQKAAAVLPDQEWLQTRADLVRRVRKSPLSQYELGMLGEFGVLQSREVSMFGFYRSFEALMARGLVVEVARSGPASRPLITYRLTREGVRTVAALGANR